MRILISIIEKRGNLILFLASPQPIQKATFFPNIQLTFNITSPKPMTNNKNKILWL